MTIDVITLISVVLLWVLGLYAVVQFVKIAKKCLHALDIWIEKNK